MSALPTPFSFSQASLQDFSDCRRRFQLRYLDKLEWPALETEPAEAHERQLQLGARFHRLVQQHHIGVPLGRLEKLAQEPQLSEWWESYLAHYPNDLPEMRQVETTLAAPLGLHRLVAKYDLLAVEPGQRLVIVDWKTGERPIPYPILSNRLQTKVYRYLLVEAGAHLNGGGPVDPARVEMLYWFTSAPDSPVRFGYDSVQHEAVRKELMELADTIDGLDPAEFPLTDDIDRCRFCRYRSLCDRGVTAGELSNLTTFLDEDGLDFDLDLDQIAGLDL